MTWLYVGIFGLLGVFSRFAIDTYIPKFSPIFSWSTFVINAIGCFIAGFFFVLASQKNVISPSLGVGLIVGFCGGFTTFSAYALQSLILAQSGLWGVALFYGIASPIIGFLSVLLGALIAKLL